MATQLPTMNDHADAVHPLHTQPDRQMDPALQARQAAASAAANPGVSKFDKDRASGDSFIKNWNQQTTAYNAKAKMRERGY